MEKYIDILKEHEFYSSAINKCQDQQCKLKMGNLKRFVSLKGEKIVGNTIAICDCIILISNSKLLICCIELKGVEYDAENIKEKMKNAKNLGFKIAQDIGIKKNQTEIIQILVAKRHPSSTLKYLRQICKSEGLIIFSENCGANLVNVLNSIFASQNEWKIN